MKMTELCDVEQCMRGVGMDIHLALAANCEGAPVALVTLGKATCERWSQMTTVIEIGTLCGPLSGKQYWRCGMN